MLVLNRPQESDSGHRGCCRLLVVLAAVLIFIKASNASAQIFPDLTVGASGLENVFLVTGSFYVGAGSYLSTTGNVNFVGGNKGLNVVGGSVTAGGITGSGYVRYTSGTLNLVNTNLLIGTGGQLGSSLTLNTGGQISAGQSVTVASDGSVTFNGGLMTTPQLVVRGNMAGTGQLQGSLTVDGGGSATISDIASTGAFTVSGNSTVGGTSGTATLEVQGGLLLDSAGAMTVTANGKLLNNGTVRASSLSNSGLIDLNGLLIVNYDGTDPFNDMQSQIVTGRAGGTWDGPGIQSSSAATADPGEMAIGIAQASDLFASPTTFDGQAIDGTTVIARYTYAGDVNLDAQVNIDDVVALAQHFNSTGEVWTGGDFNYDGNVDVDDLNLLATNWQAGTSAPLGPSLVPLLASLGLPVASVPEPAGFGALVALLWTLNRSRRHNASSNRRQVRASMQR